MSQGNNGGTAVEVCQKTFGLRLVALYTHRRGTSESCISPRCAYDAASHSSRASQAKTLAAKCADKPLATHCIPGMGYQFDRRTITVWAGALLGGSLFPWACMSGNGLMGTRSEKLGVSLGPLACKIGDGDLPTASGARCARNIEGERRGYEP